MESLSREVLEILYGLMPGFVAALVYHSFTAHEEKKQQWERILQALIFTGIIKALVIVVKWVLVDVGTKHPTLAFGPWTDNCALLWSYILAIVFGCIAALAINKDWLHYVGRALRFTKETGAPTEWWRAFNKHEWYIVLHLKGGKRLYGWPEQWPNKYDSGHFSIKQPAWFKDDGSEMWPLPQLERLLVPAADVSIVEMYKKPEELNKLGLSEKQIQELQKPLAALHAGKENGNG